MDLSRKLDVLQKIWLHHLFLRKKFYKVALVSLELQRFESKQVTVFGTLPARTHLKVIWLIYACVSCKTLIQWHLFRCTINYVQQGESKVLNCKNWVYWAWIRSKSKLDFRNSNCSKIIICKLSKNNFSSYKFIKLFAK